MKRILSLGLIFFSLQAMGQQLYYSQYQLTPLLNNPSLLALTDELKIDVGYRNQFGGKGGNYATPLVAGQMPFFNESVKNVFEKFGAAGAQFYTDRTGYNGMLATTGFSAAYAHLVNLSTRDRLAFGLQPGIYQRRVDFSKLESGSQWDAFYGTYSQGLPLNENIAATERRTFFTLNGGITYIRYNSAQEPLLTISLGGNNLTRPNISLNSQSFKNPMHWNFQASGKAYENLQFIVKPTVRHVQVGNLSQTNLGSYVYYKLPKSQGIIGEGTVGLGAWYSNKNAVVLALEINQKDWALGFSYDFLTSSLADAQNSTGAPEIIIGFRKYLGKRQKQYEEKGGGGQGGGNKSDINNPKKAVPTEGEINRETEVKPTDPKAGEADKPAVERQDAEKKDETITPPVTEKEPASNEEKPSKPATPVKASKTKPSKKTVAKPTAKKKTTSKPKPKSAKKYSNLSPEMTKKLEKVRTSDDYLGQDPYAGTPLALTSAQLDVLKQQPRFGLGSKHDARSPYAGVELDERGESQLRAMAKILKDRPKMKLEIGGFGCDLGGPEVTKVVALGRAESVRRYLAAQGVPANQLSIKSYGMENPEADNSEVEGKIANRRVQFKFIK